MALPPGSPSTWVRNRNCPLTTGDDELIIDPTCGQPIAPHTLQLFIWDSQMAPRDCRLEKHKGRTSTNPALNRYGRSRSAFYRADMAMGNRAQWSFHALRARLAWAAHTCPVGRPRCSGRRTAASRLARATGFARLISAVNLVFRYPALAARAEAPRERGLSDARMSAFQPVSSALHPGADLHAVAARLLLVTQLGHP